MRYLGQIYEEEDLRAIWDKPEDPPHPKIERLEYKH